MNNNVPLISIIIPVFNEEKTILEVLKRIHNVIDKQTVFEIIVINDGSTDNTIKLLEDNTSFFDQIITYQKNVGKGNAVKGLELSKGKYIFSRCRFRI